MRLAADAHRVLSSAPITSKIYLHSISTNADMSSAQAMITGCLSGSDSNCDHLDFRAVVGAMLTELASVIVRARSASSYQLCPPNFLFRNFCLKTVRYYCHTLAVFSDNHLPPTVAS